MPSNYSIDTKAFTLKKLHNLLKSKHLLPGRVMLKNNIDENFEILKNLDIKNLEDLFSVLKSKKKLVEFSEKSGISEEYLSILNREAKSYIPKPLNLKVFEEFDCVSILEENGIKRSDQLWDLTLTKNDRLALAKKLNINEDELTHLSKLCDLSRIIGVGPVFARILYEANIQTAEQFMQGELEELAIMTNEMLDKMDYKSPKIKARDIQYCFDMGMHLSLAYKS